jgi:hypothetical protein
VLIGDSLNISLDLLHRLSRLTAGFGLLEVNVGECSVKPFSGQVTWQKQAAALNKRGRRLFGGRE